MCAIKQNNYRSKDFGTKKNQVFVIRLTISKLIFEFRSQGKSKSNLNIKFQNLMLLRIISASSWSTRASKYFSPTVFGLEQDLNDTQRIHKISHIVLPNVQIDVGCVMDQRVKWIQRNQNRNPLIKYRLKNQQHKDLGF